MRRRLTLKDWLQIQAHYALKDKKSDLYNKVMDDEAREIAAQFKG